MYCDGEKFWGDPSHFKTIWWTITASRLQQSKHIAIYYDKYSIIIEMASKITWIWKDKNYSGWCF